MEKTFAPSQLSGITAAPASKSEAHRRMICAGLGREAVTLTGFMDSADMAATRRCLCALGAAVSQDGDRLTLQGGRRDSLPEMDCGESGSTLRFFVPLSLALQGGADFVMHGRLGQRPMDVYESLLTPRGISWQQESRADGAALLRVRGRLMPGDYALPGNVSSQFVTGLLFALPLLSGDSTLTVTGAVESGGYIRMTLEALTQSGIRVEELAPYAWRIPGNQSYHGQSGRLSGDWSQAAVLLCAGAMGHRVTVTALAADTTQGDRAVLSHLMALGAMVREEATGTSVYAEQLHGATLNMRDCPDIAPILALTCQLAEGESRLTGCGRLRIKESDRLSATVDMLNALGGCAHAEGDDMVIRGVPALRGGVTVEGSGDHRMVMLAAIAATRCLSPVTVRGTEALNKSWPGFLEQYAQLGGRVE